MSSLKVRQVKTKLLELFEPHLDLSDLSTIDKDRENKILSRCLAAHAVFMRTGCAEQEAAEAVWDGSGDNGIDAAFHKISEARVIAVQSKWINAGSGEPAAKDLATFANGVRDLIEQNSSNFSEKLQSQIIDINNALMTPGVTVEIIVISTGNSVLAKPGSANLERMLEELNLDDTEPLASMDVIGLNEVYDSLASNTATDNIKITANLSDWSTFSQPFSAYFGIIDGLQIKDWWAEYGTRLVAKNIRHALGATDINDGIRDTATKKPEHFWYFNNGITLIADKAVRAPRSAASRSSGIFEFTGASIVNGAQTVSTLARIDTDENLGKVRVPIRIIILEETPEKFGVMVTRTNNLQNRVEGRDFVAEDPEQLRLQKEMSMEGIDYQFLRGEDVVISDRSCELIEVTIALACASADPGLAVQAKTGTGRFFNDLKRAPYKTIYNSSLSGAYAFNATLVQRRIDKWIQLKQHKINKKSGYSWGALVHGNRILAACVFKLLGDQILIKTIDDFDKSLETYGIDDKCDKIYNAMVNILNAQYPGKFLAVLFKSPAKSKIVFDDSIQKVTPT